MQLCLQVSSSRIFNHTWLNDESGYMIQTNIWSYVTSTHAHTYFYTHTHTHGLQGVSTYLLTLKIKCINDYTILKNNENKDISILLRYMNAAKIQYYYDNFISLPF